MKTLPAGPAFSELKRGRLPWSRGVSLVRTLQSAFTRLDLLAALLAVGGLFLCVWPALAHSRSRSDRLQCVGNLRLIGLAFHLWGNDHGDYLPWRVLQDSGGTMPASGIKPGAVWFEFSWMSNQLKSPKILVCPSDAGTRRVAEDFSNRPDGGFLHFSYRANAVSYFLGLDVWPELGRAVVSGDRNLRVDSVGNNCSTRVNNAAAINVESWYTTVAQWTNGIHELTGNLLLSDGHALETSDAVMRQAFQIDYDQGSAHLLMPK